MKRGFKLFTDYIGGRPRIYLWVGDDRYALRFEAVWDCDHGKWKRGDIEYHIRQSKGKDDHVCSIWEDDSCYMHTEPNTWNAGDDALKALQFDDSDTVYRILSDIWETRPIGS